MQNKKSLSAQGSISAQSGPHFSLKASANLLKSGDNNDHAQRFDSDASDHKRRRKTMSL